MAQRWGGLGALLYLDVRILANRVRLIRRDARRLVPWLIVLVWVIGSRALRLVGARHVPASTALPILPVLAAFVPGAALILLGAGAWGAVRRAPAVFTSPADGRFLIGSRIAPRLVVAWLLARRSFRLLALSVFNVLLLLVFVPADGASPSRLLLLLLALTSGYVLLQTVPMDVFLLRRHLPPGLARVPGAVLLSVGAASALLAVAGLLGIGAPLPDWLAGLLLQAPPGEWVRAAYEGSWAAMLALLAIAVATSALAAALSGDTYPELWESSTRNFTLRSLMRAGAGVAARRQALGLVRRRDTTSASEAWAPPGAAALVWKEWLATRRSPGGLRLQLALNGGALGAGAVVGLALRAGRPGQAATMGALAVLPLLMLSVYGSVRLGADLRNPVWWLSADPLRSRLLAWTVASAARQGLPLLLGCGLGLLVAGQVALAGAAVIAIPIAAWAIRALALASYALVPSRTDMWGPGRLLRMLLTQAMVLPTVAVVAVLLLATGSAVGAALGAAAVLAGAGWLQLELAAWLIRSRGIAQARAEAR